MDSSFTIKPRDSISRTGIGRARLAHTELAPSQSVTDAKPTEDTHVPLVESAGREPVINPQAQALLNREQEERMRRARQAADEALLRQRAYGQSAINSAISHTPAHDAERNPDNDPHADIEA